ncbi:MAG: serine hydrolase [Sedimentisphaerales bacterium]|nr:serine hydrolase [Sedimentisphaerales bacterium]
MICLRRISTAALLVLVLAAACPAPQKSPEIYPGKQWDQRRPQQLGMDTDALKAFSNYARGFGCVVRNGYMAYTWGDPAAKKDIASAVKPFYTHFLLRAVEKEMIPGINEPVENVEPALASLNPQLQHKDRQITWRHLCNQISGYGVTEPPGKTFDYSDWNMALFFDALFLKAYNTTWENIDTDVLRPYLTDILQCQDNPTFMAFGTGDRPGRMAISPRDFARFGLLYLRQGRWKDKQLITPQHAKLAVTTPLPTSIPRTKGEKAQMLERQRSIGGGNNQCDHNGSYSFAWWINGIGRDGTRNWPDVPADTFGCFGHGDIRAMVVIPSLDLIVAWNDTGIEGREKVNHALKLLCDAVIEKPTQEKQIVPNPDNPRWLTRTDAAPFFMCGPGDPEDFLYRGKLNPDGTRNGDQQDLIEKLKRSGANCIYLMAVRSHGGDGDKTHNPFVENDPEKGINEKILQQWENWFAEMDQNQIVIYIFLYDDGTNIWKTADSVEDAERRFIRTIVRKFKHHDNLIWAVAEEYQEALTAARVSAIAAEIRKHDDRKHPIAVHKLNGLTFDEFADDKNIDQFAIQYNVETPQQLHAGILQAWNAAKGGYNLNMAEAAGFGAGKTMRDKCWACAMAGAYVMILDMDIADTPEADLQACGSLVRFFEHTDFDKMAPRDELALEAAKYVLADPPRSYIAYSPNAHGKIGLKNLTAGKYDFRWFDCQTAKQVLLPAVSVGPGNQSWTIPETIGPELALHIKRVSQ